MRFLGADGLVGDKKADAPGRGILSVHNVRGAGDHQHERFFPTTLIGIITITWTGSTSTRDRQTTGSGRVHC